MFDKATLEMAQGTIKNNLHVSLEFLNVILDGHALGDPFILAFRDPKAVVAGNLHSYPPAWDTGNTRDLKQTWHWVKNGIINCVVVFFQPFKGQYKRGSFESFNQFPLQRPFLMPFLVNNFLSLSRTLFSPT